MRFRRCPAETTRRQRLSDDQSRSKLSSFAYSSNNPRIEERSDRQPGAASAQKRRANFGRYWLQRIGLLVFLVAVAASVINVLSLSSSAIIKPLTSSTNQAFLQPTAVYEAAADQMLKSSVWNHSKITVDAGGLSQKLLNKFPELSSASVTVPLLAHRPLIYIEPAQPALILAASNGAYVIDTTGKALAIVNQPTTSSASLPILTDQSGLEAKINRQALPATDVKFTQVVLAELAAKQFTAASLSLPPASSELDVYLAGQPYFVKFNLQNNDPAGQAGTFLATIASLKQQSIVPAHYVDVRVDGRAYYQ